MINAFGHAYKNKKVMITGHTGFKGSWLLSWLHEMGAKVTGLSLNPPSSPDHFTICGFAKKITSIKGDICDFDTVSNVIKKNEPDIIIHMAAQSLVRRSYREPTSTYRTNILGTINMFEACRQSSSVKAIINITSDKCYENREIMRGYQESDPLGGHDPYSASKGCAEIISRSYRNSFFPVDQFGKDHETLIATVRAGNVIGGGDWGEDRLVPDIMRAASDGKSVYIRNPGSVRPWQHVLEPLSGYLLLGQYLMEGKKEYAGAWNFGPDDGEHKDVLFVVKELKKHWQDIRCEITNRGNNFHEAVMLKLDCTKAKKRLQWKPVWNFSETILKTAEWYREFYQRKEILTLHHLEEYVNNARKQGISWAFS